MINYIKPNNDELFNSMEKLNFSKIQNYIPIYNEFFMLNKTNFNSIQLQNEWILKSINAKINEDKQTYTATISNIKTNNVQTTQIFIKEAPLIDPFKFITGKYKNTLSCINNLPSFTYTPLEKTNSNYIIPKVLNTQNSAYVDGLFNYINGCLQNEGFIHGISFYGSYISLKQNYSFNIADDFEYLMHSSYFKKNNGLLFNIPSTDHQKRSLHITDSIDLKIDMGFDDIIELPSTFGESTDTNTQDNNVNMDELDLIEQYNDNKSLESSSEYSSDDDDSVDEDDIESLIYPVNYISTFTPCITTHNKHIDIQECSSDLEEELDDNDDNSWSTMNSSKNNKQSDEGDEDTSSYDTDIDEYIEAVIPTFPVHLICIEKCKNTLDSLIVNNKLSEDELFSCMIQIIMILITYQSGFKFTHNDLHTNNIVYTETTTQYIYYIYKDQKYLVPTYGKLYKIIDFGRSIYSINNLVICSDSYQKHEDSYSQYNFGPCLQQSKPIIEPNYSFDLCRLACSMIDEFIDSYDSHSLSNMTPFTKLLLHMCLDDHGYHILYKKNREERYPNFTLYKMIARTVHSHTPYNILQLECFEKYKNVSNTLTVSDEHKIIDINRILQYIKNSEDR